MSTFEFGFCKAWPAEYGGSDTVLVSGIGHLKLAASTSCLLGHLLLEPSHHVGRKPRSHVEVTHR